MVMGKKLLLSFGLAALLVVGILTAAAQEGMGGKLVIADASSNTSLDPFVTSWHSWPHYAIYATLFQLDTELNYVGYLADTWEVSEDGTEMTIKLIETATFSDGTPVNAEAIKWNIMKYADPEATASQGADLRGLITDVEVIDDYTFKLMMSSSYAPLYNTLAGLEIVSPTAYEAAGADNFGTNPVGAGPFILKELNTDNYVSFVPRPEFNWAPEEIYANTGPVTLDEFEIRFIGEEQTILSAFETGELQIAGIPPQNIINMEGNPDITLVTQMENGIRYFGFNTSKAPWDNVELRRAFNYAINRDEFVQLAWDGRCEPLYQPLPPTIWGHNPELDATSYQFDPARASAILDELGYVDTNGDGLREQPDGSEWVVPFAATGDDEWRRQAEVIEAQLRDVGIPLRIDLMERQALIDLTTTGEHDLFLLNYGQTEPSILTYFFDPDRRGGSNRTWYVNDELTALLKAADSDLNRETRWEKIQQINQIVIEQSPWVFLCVPNGTTGLRNEFQGWMIHPQGDIMYWNSFVTGG
jgi:peptide/nickel transport system substrate-binding protein